MRFVQFRSGSSASSEAHVGALLGDGRSLVDLTVALGGRAAPALSTTWWDLDGPLAAAARATVDELASASPGRIAEARAAGHVVDAASVKLTASVPRPGKIICIGLNYRDHAIESNMPIPESPIIFSKFATSVVGPEDAVVIPPGSTQSDYEAEMAVIIGRRVSRLPKDRAYEAVFGYSCFNDVSARDFQFADKQWTRGKACDTFAPIGPFIATKDEIRDPHALRIQLRLNGQTMQDSSTNQLIFGVPAIIEFLSSCITLEPGDVIATGTPPGVGFARKPPVYLKSGDRMEVEIEGLGVLVNPVA